MQEWLISLSTHHTIWVYIFILLTACLEGPILAMIFGVLLKLGYFSFFPIYATLMAGDLLGDTAWYFIGRQWGHQFIKKFGKYFSVTEEGVEKVMVIFRKHRNRILIISKITNGFGFSVVTLITAGIARIPFFKYLGMNLLGQFVWSGILLAIGYYFSHAYMQVNNILGKMFIVAVFIGLIAAFVGFVKYMKGRMEKQ